MRSVDANKWSRDVHGNGWLWVETGRGDLLLVTYIRDDGWIVTGSGFNQSSWCCHGGTQIWIGTNEEMQEAQTLMREAFALRMAACKARAGIDAGDIFADLQRH